MTDPPALAFANHAVNPDAPNVAYAAVYPLTTVLLFLRRRSVPGNCHFESGAPACSRLMTW